MSELSEHLALIAWVKNNLHVYPELTWLVHIANEGSHVQGCGLRKSALGVQKGVPDFFLPVQRHHVAGLWIELKRPATNGKPKGRVKPEQKLWQNAMNQHGYMAVISYGAAEAIAILETYLER